MPQPTSQANDSRVIRCAGCGQETLSDRKFCGGCGGQLWEPCLTCQNVNAVDEKFCGGCGVNLAAALQEHLDELHGKLERAVRMEREGRFYEAASVLREVSAHGDERLKPLEANAVKLLEELRLRADARKAEARQLLAQAHAAFEGRRYAESLQALRAVATGLLSEQDKQLLAKVEAIDAEIKSLTANIREAVRAKNLTGLLPKVRRLCDLQPDNAAAAQLAERLARQELSDAARQATKLVALAQEKLKSRQYTQALGLLEQIRQEFRRDDTEALYLRVKEAVWCREQLQQSAFATPGLLQAARRWAETCPEDPRAPQVIEQVSQRLKVRPRDQRLALPPWKPSPSPTALGCPVNAWTGLGRVSTEDDETRKRLAKFPGRFVVAYGLALQGVGLGLLKHDLHPQPKGWSSRLLSKREKKERAWGLDVGTAGLKAVELAREGKDGFGQLTRCLLLPYATPLDRVDADQQAQLIQAALKRFVEFTEAQTPRVVLGFPGRRALPRFVNLPPVKGRKIEELVQYELRHQIPLPPDQTVFDFHLWDAQENDFEFRPAAAVAVRRDDVQQWIAPVTAAGCEVAALQCDGFAIYNALHHEFIASRKSKNDESAAAALAVLDIGRSAANLVIGGPNFVWFRSFAQGASQWDKILASELKLTVEQAEKVRRDFSLARRMHRVDELLQPKFADLADEVLRSVHAFPERRSSVLKMVLACGGGAAQYGLLQHLACDSLRVRNPSQVSA